VIRYSYLWASEARQGREEGVKDRPCAIILVILRSGEHPIVRVLPITHAPPVDLADALEIPAPTKQRLKLDSERWEKKLEHWRGVMLSACEQSGRTAIPQIQPVQKLDAWLAASGTGPRFVLAPGGHHSLKQLPQAQAATLLVGPEGGLSDEEIALAVHRGFTAIGLGPRVLRTETAGVAALAALQALWGDLG